MAHPVLSGMLNCVFRNKLYCTAYYDVMPCGITMKVTVKVMNPKFQLVEDKVKSHFLTKRSRVSLLPEPVFHIVIP